MAQGVNTATKAPARSNSAYAGILRGIAMTASLHGAGGRYRFLPSLAIQDRKENKHEN
jgi:hypothetical protein